MAASEKHYRVAKRDFHESKKRPAPTVLHTGLKRACLEGDLLPKQESPFAKATRLLLAHLSVKQEPIELITIADDPPEAVAPQPAAPALSTRELQRNSRRRRREETIFGPEGNQEPQPSTSAGPPAPPPDSTNWADDDEGALRIDDPSEYPTDTDSRSDLEAEEDLINNTIKIVLSDK